MKSLLGEIEVSHLKSIYLEEEEKKTEVLEIIDDAALVFLAGLEDASNDDFWLQTRKRQAFSSDARKHLADASLI